MKRLLLACLACLIGSNLFGAVTGPATSGNNMVLTGTTTQNGVWKETPRVVSGTVIDFSLGNVFTKTLTADSTFTFSNFLNGRSAVVIITNTGSFYALWPSSGTNKVKWIPDDPQQSANEVDTYTLWKLDGVVRGQVLQIPAYTAGDLLVATNGTRLARLAVGTDGQVPTADSTAPLKISFQTPAAATFMQTNNGTAWSPTFYAPVYVKGDGGTNQMDITATSTIIRSYNSAAIVRGFRFTPNETAGSLDIHNGSTGGNNYDLTMWAGTRHNLFAGTGDFKPNSGGVNSLGSSALPWLNGYFSGNIRVPATFTAINATAKTTAYTATLLDHTIRCSTAGGAFSVTLPTAASAYDSTLGVGLILIIKKTSSDANALTLDANGTEVIDGATSSQTKSTILQGQGWVIQSNGTSWDQLPALID